MMPVLRDKLGAVPDSGRCAVWTIKIFPAHQQLSASYAKAQQVMTNHELLGSQRF